MSTNHPFIEIEPSDAERATWPEQTAAYVASLEACLEVKVIKETVRLEWPLDEAEVISDGLSDLLCWCMGFVAACGDDTSRHPFNFETVRDVRIKLKAAIRQARRAAT